jgi:peroxiredoxin/mono/diheme cytochrome c family protein
LNSFRSSGFLLQSLYTLALMFPAALMAADPSLASRESESKDDAETAAAVSVDASVDFTLKDFHGRDFRLSDHADRKAVVLIFLGTECPLVRLYAAKLPALAVELESLGAMVVGINSNRQDSLTEIAAFARQFDLQFPLLRDPGNQLADRINAQRTPEVFVLGPGTDRKVMYHGRIDDQYGIGYTRKSADHRYLIDAVQAITKGERPVESFVAAEGCLIGRVRSAKGDSSVTYSSHIAGILNRHCVQCHREGEIAPFQLTQYDEVVGWAETIREVVRDSRMPPWHADPAHGEFANERRLSAEEKSQIEQWVLAGAPAGDLTAAPPVPEKLVQDWHLGEKPDMVVSMGRVFDVPAEGTVDYEHIVVDPKFTEDKWVRAAEIVPGNRAVVHHVLVFVRGPKDTSKEVGAGGGAFFAGYVPGLRPVPLPEGMAKLIPAGSKLVFQMHYTPNGVAQSDETSIGLYFTDEKSVKHVVVTEQAINQRFKIPAREANYEVSSRSRRTRSPVQLLAMMPHMHVRGKSFRYEAVLPDGTRQPLLNVPDYDFNWQTSYRLKTPAEFPAGTQMECVGHFDNSADNPNNPDPDEVVEWGEQTWNEMMIGYFDIAIARTGERLPVPDAGPSRLEKMMTSLDQNKDGQLSKAEVPERFHGAFDRLDSDEDGQVSAKELQRLGELGL